MNVWKFLVSVLIKVFVSINWEVMSATVSVDMRQTAWECAQVYLQFCIPVHVHVIMVHKLPKNMNFHY